MKTNLEKIKNIALQYLYLDYTIKSIELFIDHPFFESVIVGYMEDNVTQILDIRDIEDWEKAQAHMKKQIEKTNSVEQVMRLVQKPWKLTFFKRIHTYLEKEQYEKMLIDCWIITEFPNKDIEVSVKDLLSLFEKADKEILMDFKDLKAYSKLSETVTVYRGFFSEDYYDALSWTISKGVASYFASRFGESGAIYKGEIDKKHIFAFIDERSEKEVICDYRMIKDIKKIK